MRIRLEVYLAFRGQRIWKGEEEVADHLTPAELLQHLGLAEQPDLAVIVNGRYWSETQPIHPGAEVAVLRRSEGG